MVPEIGAPLHERHHPAARLPVEDEHDCRVASAFPERSPAVDRPEQLFEAVDKSVTHLEPSEDYDVVAS
jgi:hypothetical protein